MKKLLIVTTSLVATPLLLIFSIAYLSFLTGLKGEFQTALNHSRVAYAALPTNQNLLYDRINSNDARLEILTKFFRKYNSELLPHAETIIKTADKYSLDYRLIPAIAMQESNLCKKAPKDSYNCWGFGIYGNNLKRFTSYPRAIEAVSKTLASDYIGQGLDEPSEIQKKYTPSNDGSWSRSVNQFMAELQNTVL